MREPQRARRGRARAERLDAIDAHGAERAMRVEDRDLLVDVGLLAVAIRLQIADRERAVARRAEQLLRPAFDAYHFARPRRAIAFAGGDADHEEEVREPHPQSIAAWYARHMLSYSVR